MNGLNRAYLIGNIGSDPDLRTHVSGLSVVTLSLTTPHVRKVGDAWVDTPDWHRLTLQGRNAEYVASRARKGDKLAVECAIRPSSWVDEAGIKHHEVNLVVERILWLTSKTRVSEGADAGDPDAASGESP